MSGWIQAAMQQNTIDINQAQALHSVDEHARQCYVNLFQPCMKQRVIIAES
jgi:hypothetical protein